VHLPIIFKRAISTLDQAANMTDFDGTPPSPMRLPRGQAHWEKLPQGTRIRVVTGTLSVTRQVWAENMLLTVKTLLYQSKGFELPAPGWVELAAQSDVVVQLSAPASRFPLASLGNRLIGLFRLQWISPTTFKLL
jgi:hypothetical protein